MKSVDDESSLSLPAAELVLSVPARPARLDDVIRDAVFGALRFTGGNRAKAARLLGIDRRTLYRKLALYDKDKP